MVYQVSELGTESPQVGVRLEHLHGVALDPDVGDIQCRAP